MGLALICLIIMEIFRYPNIYLGDGKAGSGLPPADASKTRLVLDNAVRDSHLAAQGRQEHNQLKLKRIDNRFIADQVIIRGCQGCHPQANKPSGEKVQSIICGRSKERHYFYLNGVHIVGNDHELGLLLLDESGDSVDSVSHDGSPLARSVLLTLGTGGGALPQALLLGLLSLGPVLVHELEQLGG